MVSFSLPSTFSPFLRFLTSISLSITTICLVFSVLNEYGAQSDYLTFVAVAATYAYHTTVIVIEVRNSRKSTFPTYSRKAAIISGFVLAVLWVVPLGVTAMHTIAEELTGTVDSSTEFWKGVAEAVACFCEMVAMFAVAGRATRERLDISTQKKWEYVDIETRADRLSFSYN
ncbi:hypothetical protein ARMGADRAFT_748577 [Armillaria gallica]|uniref:Uncharacterized protein n=1 Tax=Armillaria gallica TaxID=47427 RepID=A0A2H3E375_ARMGA|nr:hypothetical protein ARMGADRAFT_748577 [Armillaria gallica]